MMEKRIILVGPYPPPYHGTSIPLEHLDNFIQDQELADTIIINTLTRYNLPIYHPRVIGTYLKLTLQLIRSLPGVDAVLITGSQGFISSIGSLFSWISKVVFKKRVSVYAHGGGFDQFFFSKGVLAQRWIQWNLNRADHFIVQTRQLGDALKPKFSNLSIIPNWTKIHEIKELSKARDGSDPAGRGNTVRYIYCGEIRKEKGIQELILAFKDLQKKLADSNRRATLDLYGQTNPNFQDIFDGLLKDAQDANVHYQGYLDHSDLMSKLADYDVLILPTYLPTEGYPGVIIEAMSVGLPVLTTRWRALPEIVVDGKNGLLAEPMNREDLVEKLVTLTLDDELRKALGSKAFQEADQFDTEVVLPGLCSLIGL